MFGRKAHGDVKKSAGKVIDPKKDSVTRLKHLRIVLDNYELADTKGFFEQHYSHIYYIFHDVFSNVETELKQRANKTHREELDYVLFIFEKILTLLPDLIHKRWQYHSIGRLMKKLLHTGNCFKLRREGMRLFLIWYQILMDNATDECHKTYKGLVPPLGLEKDGLDLDIFTVRTSTDSAVCAVEISPVLPPQAGEKQADNRSLTRLLLDALLEYMVTEVNKVEWENSVKHSQSFNFLFNKFKEYYLLNIFPDFKKDATIFFPDLDLPDKRGLDRTDGAPPLYTPEEMQCRECVIRWLATFTHNLQQKREISSISEVRDKSIESDHLTEQPPDSLAGNASTLSASSRNEKDSSSSSVCSNEDHSVSHYEIVREILYSNKENINLIHEVFRQAFLFPLDSPDAVRRVVNVYRDWFMSGDKEDLPLFMQEPLEHSKPTPVVANHSQSSQASGLNHSNTEPSVVSLNNNISIENLKAGTQRVLQVFVTNSCNVFLLEIPEKSSRLDDQVNVCKRVLNIYRHMVMNHQMDQSTWEQLLLVLLKITSTVLTEAPPIYKETSLGGRLAQPIFQTLIVTWIKAALNVYLSSELWDKLLHVLSSLTAWIELIREWAKTLETLTRVLARQVYGLDLHDLPLDRLTEQKEKRRRGTKHGPPKTSHGLMFGESSTSSQVSSTGSLQTKQDMYRQRSRSGESSPRRCSTTSQDDEALVPAPGPLVRSSSDTSVLIEAERRGSKEILDTNGKMSEMQDTHSLCDEVLDVSVRGPDNGSLASTSTVTDSTSMVSVDSSHVPYQTLELSPDTNSLSLDRSSISDRSDTEGLLKDTSPLSGDRNSDLSCGGLEDSGEKFNGDRRDSTTPERESLHMDDEELQNSVAEHATDNEMGRVTFSLAHRVCGDSSDDESGLDSRSILSGGQLIGWTPDVAVVLWRRMLGILGDINKVKDPDIHAQVYEHLCDLMETLLNMRNNMAVTKDNQNSPPPPDFVPPILVITPWLFEALSLPDAYQQGKLLAYRLLCMATVRHKDLTLSEEHLGRFYRAVHSGLTHDQETINVLVRNCGPRFFSLPLPGATMLILDFIHATDTITSSTEIKDKEAPRAEAVSMLGSLLCYPNHYGSLPVLQPESSHLTLTYNNNIKDHVIDLLLNAGKKEPAGLARCIAISSLGIFLYEELMHGTMHPKLKEAVGVLLATLRFNNKAVAQVAADMLMLLCDHVQLLLNKQPEVPRRIIEVMANVISSLLPSTEHSNSEEDKRLLVSVMFCLLEWAMHVPVSTLLDTSGGHKCLLYKIFKVLNLVVCGSAGRLTPRGSLPLSEATPNEEDELGVLRESPSSIPSTPRTPQDAVDMDATMSSMAAATAAINNRNKSSTSHQHDSSPLEKDLLKLSARTVMCWLVNHLGHFPMGGGASQLNTTVQEHHDMEPRLDELSPDIFSLPNVQFFVVNSSTLMSLVEIPALTDLPGGGVTVGLTTAKTVVRVVIRDLAGKVSWDSSVLYGPPKCRSGSYPAEPEVLLQIIEDMDLLGRSEDDDNGGEMDEGARQPNELPLYEQTKDNSDNLHQLLEYVGHTSPECLLRLGKPLNLPFPIPEEVPQSTEQSSIDFLMMESKDESEHHQVHQHNPGMSAKTLDPMETRDTSAAFQLCRLYLNQLGFLQWEKRARFDLLKKSEKLLRELKHLDNYKCRETHKIAVIYVGKGQEDKQSVLSNTRGSQQYEDFIAGLGWEVDLMNHDGFMGGLQHNKSTGATAPYYATSTREVVFHVSTRMPSDTQEDKHRKLRHLGNDEVQIIWSEHTRDYRRGIIPTEFGDVLIIIYPLENRLYRIQINRKPEVTFFGPLFDGAIVDHKILPGLVRATALNASQVLRLQKPFYQAFFEERTRYVDTLVQQHREQTTFEDFAVQVFLPVLPPGDQLTPPPTPACADPSLSGLYPARLSTSSMANSSTTSLSTTGDSADGKSSTSIPEKQSPHASNRASKDGTGESAITSTSSSSSSGGGMAGTFGRRLSLGKNRKSAARQSANHLKQLETAQSPPSPKIK